MEELKRQGGRPTKYRESVARAICIRLMLGESLNQICKRETYPSRVTVFAWIQKYPEFLNKYRHAREMQQETHLDEIMEISDDSTNDYMERTGKGGESVGWQLNAEHVQRSKLRIDTRKWVMERMAAKVYGAKQGIDLTTNGGPVQVITQSMTPQEAADLYARSLESDKG